jgi:hypothetical protein
LNFCTKAAISIRPKEKDGGRDLDRHGDRLLAEQSGIGANLCPEAFLAYRNAPAQKGASAEA